MMRLAVTIALVIIFAYAGWMLADMLKALAGWR
jgi:hypothetical protein